MEQPTMHTNNGGTNMAAALLRVNITTVLPCMWYAGESSGLEHELRRCKMRK